MNKLPRFFAAIFLALCFSAPSSAAAHPELSRRVLRPQTDHSGLEEKLFARPEPVEGQSSRAGVEEKRTRILDRLQAAENTPQLFSVRSQRWISGGGIQVRYSDPAERISVSGLIPIQRLLDVPSQGIPPLAMDRWSKIRRKTGRPLPARVIGLSNGSVRRKVYFASEVPIEEFLSDLAEGKANPRDWVVDWYNNVTAWERIPSAQRIKIVEWMAQHAGGPRPMRALKMFQAIAQSLGEPRESRQWARLGIRKVMDILQLRAEIQAEKERVLQPIQPDVRWTDGVLFMDGLWSADERGWLTQELKMLVSTFHTRSRSHRGNHRKPVEISVQQVSHVSIPPNTRVKEKELMSWTPPRAFQQVTLDPGDSPQRIRVQVDEKTLAEIRSHWAAEDAQGRGGPSRFIREGPLLLLQASFYAAMREVTSAGVEETGQEKTARLLREAFARSDATALQICFLCNRGLERSPTLELLARDFAAKNGIDWLQVQSAAVLPWLTQEELGDDDFIPGEILQAAAQQDVPIRLINELANRNPRWASDDLLKESDLILVTSRFLVPVLEAKLREELGAGEPEKIQARLQWLVGSLGDRHLRENLPPADWGTVEPGKEEEVQRIMDRVVTFADFLGPDHSSLSSSTGSLRVIVNAGGETEFVRQMQEALQPLFRQLKDLNPSAGVEEAPKHRVAVIGAGPAGMAAAQRLVELGHEVDLFDEKQLYGGLAVFGVYPNKEDPMKMAYRFKSLGPTVVLPGVRFYGGVRVGKDGDLTLEDLQRLGYSAVVVAIGADGSKPLGIPDEPAVLPGLYQAKDLVAFYQEDPAKKDLDPQLGKTAVFIGIGNVTVDTTHYAIHRRDYHAVEKFVRSLQSDEWKHLLRTLKQRLPSESQLRRNLSFYRPGVGRTVDVDELHKALQKAKLDEFIPRLDQAWQDSAAVESVREAYWMARRGPDQKMFEPRELDVLAPYIDLDDLREELKRVAVALGWGLSDNMIEQHLVHLLFEHPKAKTIQGNPAEKLKKFGTRLDKARIRMRFLLRAYSLKGDHAGQIIFAKNLLKGDELVKTEDALPPGELFQSPIDSVVLSIGNEHDQEFGLEIRKGLFVARQETPPGEKPSVPAQFQSVSAENLFLAGWALLASTGKVGEAMNDGASAVNIAVGPYLHERSDSRAAAETRAARRADLDRILEEKGIQAVSGGQATALHAWFIQNGYQPNDRAEIQSIARRLEETKITAEIPVEARLPSGLRIFAHKNAIPKAAQKLFTAHGISIEELPDEPAAARYFLEKAGDLSHSTAWISPTVEWYERDEWDGLFQEFHLRAIQPVGVMPFAVDHWSLAHWAALFGAFPKAGLQVILSVEEVDRGLSIYV